MAKKPTKKSKAKSPAAQYNIFQANELIRKVIATAWGYPLDDPSSSMTEDIYFQAYFYLCNRFGPPRRGEVGRNVGEWAFKVKWYTICIQMNSCWVQVLMYGNGTKEAPLARRNFRTYSARSPYWVRVWRESQRKKHLLIDLVNPSKDPENKATQNRVWQEFCQQEGIDKTWTEERFAEEKLKKWMDYVDQYNKDIIGVNYAEFSEKHGHIYRNAQTSHALRTLTCFLHNMLTPIWIRDVGYNIKGQCGSEFDHFENNIKFEFITT